MIPIIKSTHKPSRKAVREAIRNLGQSLAKQLIELPIDDPRIPVLNRQLERINIAIEQKKGAHKC